MKLPESPTRSLLVFDSTFQPTLGLGGSYKKESCKCLPNASKDLVLRDYVEDCCGGEFVEKETEADVGEEVVITSSTSKRWSSRTAWRSRRRLFSKLCEAENVFEAIELEKLPRSYQE